MTVKGWISTELAAATFLPAVSQQGAGPPATAIRPSPTTENATPGTTDPTVDRQSHRALHDSLEELQTLCGAMFDGMLIGDCNTKQVLWANSAICEKPGYSEEELRESEQRYRALFEQAADAIVIIDPETGDLVEFNDRAQENLGYTREEFHRLKIPDFEVHESAEEVAEHIARIIRQGGDAFETKHRRKNGELRDIVVSSRVVSLGGRDFIQSIWRDVTDRRRAEASSRLLASAVQQSIDGIAVSDLEGNLQFLNDAFAAMHGYTPEELVGKHLSILHTPEQMPSVRAANRQLQETGKLTGRIWHARRDGSVFPTLMHNSLFRDEMGDFVGMIGTARDITDLKRTEEELTAHRDHLEELVQERTSELAKANQRLLEEIAERKRAEEAVEEERRLLRQLLDFQEQERRLVAYEIHDGLAQQLTGALLQFQAFGQLRDRSPDEAQKAFDDGLDLLRESVNEARRLISGFRPPVLDESGIITSIEYLICEQQKRDGPEIEFLHDIRADRLASPLETALFRIAQEALANACRHSTSDTVRVELTEQRGRVHLEVRDWGIGFNLEKVGKHSSGLQGIRERARLLGGRATIDVARNKGTRVAVDLPLLEKLPDGAGALPQ